MRFVYISASRYNMARMKRFARVLLLLIWLTATWLPLAAPAAAAPARQAATVTPTPTKAPAKPADVKPLLDKMSVADKVGQLFLVTFIGDNVAAESDIATLVRDYRVGGVVLLPANGNFRSVPAPAPTFPITATQGQAPTQTAQLTTPQQIARLTNALQSLALTPARPITATATLTTTAALTATATLTATRPATAIAATATITPTRPAAAIAPTGTLTGAQVPLLIGLDWTGDDTSFFAGTGGFSPLPSAMALGATWSPSLAERTGVVVGQELRAVGVNLLLGPPLDVLDVPRPGDKGDLDTRSFGGDPFWVGQMGLAFIRGVQAGAKSGVLTAAKHFPGQGASDRRPDDEVATVQKSLQQLRQIELAPFAAVTSGSDLTAARRHRAR